MLFENDNGYFDMLFNFNDNYNYSSSTNEEEGFLKGNMFENEYEPYKNYSYARPKITGEKETLLYDIMKYTFAVIDYNLYLDVYPEDTNILSKYKMACDKLEDLMKEFEKKYGPLSVTASNYDTFKWIESPWPWERKDGKYV